MMLLLSALLVVAVIVALLNYRSRSVSVQYASRYECEIVAGMVGELYEIAAAERSCYPLTPIMQMLAQEYADRETIYGSPSDTSRENRARDARVEALEKRYYRLLIAVMWRAMLHSGRRSAYSLSHQLWQIDCEPNFEYRLLIAMSQVTADYNAHYGVLTSARPAPSLL